jgi:hypothetical protein
MKCFDIDVNFFSGLVILFHNELSVGMVMEFRITVTVFMSLIEMKKNLHKKHTLQLFLFFKQGSL